MAPKTAKKAPVKKKPTTKKKPKVEALSALDAAAKILADAKAPMTTKELVDAMAAKGLWKSPEGKTPDRTLYTAITREITKKGRAARFKKAEKGKFPSAGRLRRVNEGKRVHSLLIPKSQFTATSVRA
jgi:HB1, ASXL, restriction endonuclease HTH domain